MRELDEVRKDIDEVDREIVSQYLKRLHLAGEVAEYKIESGKRVYDKVREEEKLEKLSSYAEDEFSKQGIRELFTQVMSGSRKKQYEILAQHGRVASFSFVKKEQFDFSDARIIYQGVEGAYSEAAAIRFFGEEHDFRSVHTWREAFEELKNDTADYAVLPIENSTAGAISENYDLMSEYIDTASIIGEQIISIDHALLGLPGADISKIKTVYSHPQALMQCESYLREQHPEFETRSFPNTAMSAKKVMEDGDITKAAIAGKINAKLYGLEVLEEKIQDVKFNQTRFLVVSKKHEYLSDAKKLSLSFTLQNDMGSLYHVLSNFTYNGLNMSRIESRPTGEPWQYRFFIECDGNLSDGAVENCLLGLIEETGSLQILGNY